MGPEAGGPGSLPSPQLSQVTSLTGPASPTLRGDDEASPSLAACALAGWGLKAAAGNHRGEITFLGQELETSLFCFLSCSLTAHTALGGPSGSLPLILGQSGRVITCSGRACSLGPVVVLGTASTHPDHCAVALVPSLLLVLFSFREHPLSFTSTYTAHRHADPPPITPLDPALPMAMLRAELLGAAVAAGPSCDLPSSRHRA